MILFMEKVCIRILFVMIYNIYAYALVNQSEINTVDYFAYFQWIYFVLFIELLEFEKVICYNYANKTC